MRDFSGVAGASGGLAVNNTRWTPEVGNAIVQEISNVIRAEDAGGADLNPSDNSQLLQAIRTMIGGGISSPDTQTLIVGNWVIKRGRHRAAVSSETTAYIEFANPFPNSLDSVLLTGAIAFPNVRRDLWPQIDDSSTTVFGFGVQYQSDDGNDHGLSGFDWVAIGK